MNLSYDHLADNQARRKPRISLAGSPSRLLTVLALALALILAFCLVLTPVAAATTASRQPTDSSLDFNPVSNLNSTSTQHRLRYLFAPPPGVVVDFKQDLLRPYSTYQFDIHTIETVKRDERESTLAFDFNAELVLTAEAASRSAGATANPQNFFNLHVFPFQFTATDMQNGRGSRVWNFDPGQGLTQTYRDGRVTQTALEERFVDRQSLHSAAAKPTILPLRNGALVDKPVESKFFERLRMAWMDEALISMIPPLPSVNLAVGQKWKAGLPLQFAGPTEPIIVRCDLEFRSYDPQTGMAEVGWEYQSARQSLKPTTGIHHIDVNSIANVKASGVIFLHAPTGWVRSADTIIRATIRNHAKPELGVDFIRTMHLQCHTTPTEILNWADRFFGSTPALVDADERNNDDDDD